MTKAQVSPYIAHIFICTNDRGGQRKSCADNESLFIKARLKDIVSAKGWKGKVRVSTSGCMGLCEKGPNVMIYPQSIYFSEVSPGDVDAIVTVIDRIMADD